MDLFIKLSMLFVFFATTIGIGLYCRRHATDVNGFVLGGRSVGPWLTAFAYGTSYFSAVVFVGYAGQFGWKFGIASTWAGIGNSLIGSLMAWAFLGRRTRVMTQHLSSATMPQFFSARFLSPALKTASSAIIFIFLIPYTASLYNGLSRLFGMAFDIDYSVCVIVMAILTAIYVIAGGYMATAINDFVQGIIMIIGIIAVISAVLKGQGGFLEALNKLGHVSDPAVSQTPGVFASFFGPDLLSLVGVVLLTSLGTWGLPQMVGKFYAIKNEEAISKGTIISTFFAIVVAGGCYFLGGFGRLYGDSITYGANGAPVYDSIVPQMLSGLPDVIVAIVIILVLSASMSTLSSLVLTSSSTLTLDMIVPLSKKSMDEKKKMLCIRVLIVFFIVISAAIAILQAKSQVTFIAQLMGISWGALAGAFLAPFLWGLYSKKITKSAVWASFVTGVGIMLANMACTFAGVTFISAYFSSPINAGVLSMVTGLIIVPVVSLFTKKMDSRMVDDMFECYDRTITVRASTSLEDTKAKK